MIPDSYKTKFLEELSNDPRCNISLACAKTCISRASLYRMFKKDPSFKKRVEQTIFNYRVPAIEISYQIFVQIVIRAKTGEMQAIRLYFKYVGPSEDDNFNLAKQKYSRAREKFAKGSLVGYEKIRKKLNLPD
jgi:hypothetical protein